MLSSISRWLFCLLLLPCAVAAQQSPDTAAGTLTIAKKELANGGQFRLGFDISRPLLNSVYKNRAGYELMADAYLRKEMYLVAEGGWGNSDIDYDNLKYDTKNIFFRLGIDKYLFPRKYPDDWNGAFVGLRYGVAPTSRSDAWYRTDDGLGGVTTGSTPGTQFTAQWFELTGGMRVALVQHLFAGWNVRGKFLLNKKSFGALSPAYIAGYGQGDKQSVFDISFYLSYAIRWGVKPQQPATTR
jgi:hypothetical protein